MELINNFLKWEIDLIVSIQNRFFKCEELLGHTSTLFGSTFLYLYVVPLIAIYSTKLYHRTLIACIASDFINLIMKWILDEDRPYWWVHETKAYSALTRPTLYQTERTCETSAGSPSGHLMLAACFLHVIYDEINARIDSRPSTSHKVTPRILNKVGLIVVLTVTAVSRMYFAAHFLHQCLLGGMIGIFVSVLMTRGGFAKRIARFEKRTWVTVVVWMVLSVLAVYWTHKLVNGNPMKSVQLAFKHCKDPLYPKPETTVIFSAIRCIAISCGILLNSPIIKRQPKMNMSKVAVATAILMFLQIMAVNSTPKSYKIVVFYSYSFVTYAIFQFLFINLIPKFCSLKAAQEKPKRN